MYSRYADLKGWRVEVISESPGTMGGYREVVAEVKARRLRRLKFESGAHRVQRVPDTETQGRIHTSAATWRCCRRRKRSTSRSTNPT